MKLIVYFLTSFSVIFGTLGCTDLLGISVLDFEAKPKQPLGNETLAKGFWSRIQRPPAGQVAWDWQIGASEEADLKVPQGVRIFDVDLFAISESKINSLKGSGLYMVCYINAGSYQPGLPDSDQYPDYLKLQKDPDWPGEFFLDVRDVFKPGSILARILKARLTLCRQKGFVAVEPDNLQNDENITSGIISLQDQIDFNGWFADESHRQGLAVFQKNGPDKILLKDRTGQMMVDKFDGILNEECQGFDECEPLAEYVKRGKVALNIEYKGQLDCNLSKSLNINSIKRDKLLAGGNMPSYKRTVCP